MYSILWLSTSAPSGRRNAAWMEKPPSRSQSSVPQRVRKVAPISFNSSMALCHSTAPRLAWLQGMFEGSGTIGCSNESKFIGLSSDQPRCGAIPGRKRGRHVNAQHQHHCEMNEDRHKRWRVRQRLTFGVAEDHRLDAAEDGGERDSKRDQEEWSGPGMLTHRSGEDEKFAGEHAEGRHAQNRERSQHQAPAYGGADAEQAADAIHLLRAGGLRGMARGKEDRGLGQRMNGHVQQRGKVRDRTAEAEREGDDAHVFDRGVAEETFDVALP